MDQQYLNSLYQSHKNDSDEKLQKIVSNPNKYSQESVFAAKTILKERQTKSNDTNENTNQINYDENDIAIILESIRRNTNTIKNILIFLVVIIIVGTILNFA